MKRVLALFIALVFVFFLSSCLETDDENTGISIDLSGVAVEDSSKTTKTADTINWIGIYKFTESTYQEDIHSPSTYDELPAPKAQWQYILTVFENEGKIFAYIDVIEVIPEWIRTRLIASVQNNNENARFVFMKMLVGENVGFKEGEVLLTLSIHENSLHTQWGSLKPHLEKNQPDGDYFYGGMNYEIMPPSKSATDPSIKPGDTNDLSTWTGSYTYLSISLGYEITIFEFDNRYYAYVYGAGRQTDVRVLALASGNKETVRLVVEQTSPDNFPNYGIGETLLGLFLRDGMIYTKWEAMNPNSSEYQKTGLFFSRN